MSSTVVTVKLLEVSPAANVTLVGTPEYSVAPSPAPRVAVIGTSTVTPVAGASASVRVTVAEPPSVIETDAAPNDTAIPSLGVTITWATAPLWLLFRPRISKVYSVSLVRPVNVWLVVSPSLSGTAAQLVQGPVPARWRYW